MEQHLSYHSRVRRELENMEAPVPIDFGVAFEEYLDEESSVHAEDLEEMEEDEQEIDVSTVAKYLMSATD